MTRIGLESLVREIEPVFRHVAATVVFQAVDANGDYVSVDGARVTFSPRVSIVLRDGIPDETPDLEPTDGSFGWLVKVSILSGRYSREWLKGVPTSDEVVPFGALPNLDRATLQPTEETTSAWQAAIDENRDIRDETIVLRDEAGESAAQAREVSDGIPAAVVAAIDENLDTLKGDPGADAYQVAVDAGFVGTEAQWLASLEGAAGASAYAVAVANGFSGSEAEWLASLHGEDGADPTPESYAAALTTPGPARTASQEIAVATVAQLTVWAKSPDLLVSGNVTRDGNQAVTSAQVVWPDGTPGTFTALTLSTAFPGAVDGYRITYGSPATKTFTQPDVTRNTAGAVTTVPQIVVS